VNAAKYCKAESVLMKYLQQEWAVLLPGVLVKIVLSCVQEGVKIAQQKDLKCGLIKKRNNLVWNLYRIIF